MTSSAVPARAVARALVAAAALLVLAGPARADTPERGDFDARGRGSEQAVGAPARTGAALRARLGRFGLVSIEPRTGTPRAVGRLDGFLTGPSPRPAADIALGYVREHAAVFGLDAGDLAGLRLARRARVGGVEHLMWEQGYRGIPSADTQLQAAVSASGRLLTVTGPAAPDLAVASIEPSLGAERAYAEVRRAAIAVRSRAGGAVRETRFADGGRASLVLYQDGDGARLGWRVLAPASPTEVYDAIVDARSGAVVRRSNRVDFATGKVFPVNPRDSPMPVDAPFDTWLAPGATTLTGPYAHAFVDPTDHVGFGQLTPRVEDEVSDWDDALTTFSTSSADGCSHAAPCTWDREIGDSWTQNRDQSATQLFYFVNKFHDHLAASPISFETGFAGGDPVLAQAMDGAEIRDEDHLNNASFLTLADGEPGLLQAHLFTSPFGDYDAANDASLIFHEYTHGLSNRLVTDAQGLGALNTAQAGAIGEGTSDFYALDYLVEQNPITDDPDVPDVRIGTYFNDPGGLRLEDIDTPAATGFTYEDFTGQEVHDDGEIWAQTLWDLRTRMIADHGGGGIERARRIVTDALRLSPPEPSFLDMRNAILEASTDDDDAIWQVFADRGMGYFASTDGSADRAPVADFEVAPAPGGATGTLSGTVRDDDGHVLVGAHVGIAGHDSGLGPVLAADSAADGTYAITDVPEHTYRLVIARRAGLRDGRKANVTVPGPPLDFTLVRDWSSPVNGASVERFTGPDNSASGCGPGGLIDDRLDAVWGSARADGGQSIVIDLGAPIDIAGVAIDPGAGCGDDPTAGLRDYELRGSTGPDGSFAPVGAPSAFGPDQGGALRDLAGTAAPRVRYLQLYAKTPQNTAAGTSGEEFLDVAELHVAKTPGSALGPSVETGAAQGVGAAAAGVTGTVTPHGGAAQVVFEYGPTTAYGSTVAAATLDAGESPVPVGAVIGGLQPLSVYHFRAVALRAGARYEGGDRAFTTTAAPPPVSPPPVEPKHALARIKGRKLVADRRGRFKVRVAFAADAPRGTARLAVRLKRKQVAARKFKVQRGTTVTVRLRLSKAGRKAIKRGRSKRVAVALRLPGGETVKKTVRLARRR